MNIKILTIVLLIISVFSCTSFKNETKAISSQFSMPKTIDSKARYTTSAGALKVLMVYVMFKDDTKKKSNAWKYDLTNLPLWANDMLSDDLTIKFPKQNLTQYFYEMSHGKFYLYGDVYPKLVVPQHSQDKYKSISEVNYEVLKSLDDEIDFSQYDNWTKGKDGKYINKPDGKVDMIILVYRNFENKLYWGNGWTGIAHLHMPQNIKTNDGVIISKGRLDKGSGLSARGAYNGFTYIKYILAHEFGHFLFGAAHMNNVTHLALMTGGPVWNASRGMHSWEKAKLGWIKYKDIDTSNNTTIWLDDYHTTGDAARIKISNSEWWVVENHQKLSGNDWAKGKGLYVYRLTNVTGTLPNVDVKCADGNWDFKIDQSENKLLKVRPKINGKTELNFMKRIGKTYYSANEQVYADNSAWGDKFDAFNLTYNNLISPVSNPPVKTRAPNDFAIHVTEQNGSKLKIKFIFNDIYKNTPPSKPQLINVEKSGSQYYLNWMKNKEPDMSHYLLMSLHNKNITVLDKLKKENVRANITKYLKTNLPRKIFLKAVDNDGNQSVNSEYYYFYFNEKKKVVWKRIEE